MRSFLRIFARNLTDTGIMKARSREKSGETHGFRVLSISFPRLHEGNNNACTVRYHPYQAFHKFLPSLEVSLLFPASTSIQVYGTFPISHCPRKSSKRARNERNIRLPFVPRVIATSALIFLSLSLYSGDDRWRLIATVSIYKFQKNVVVKESSLLRTTSRMKIRPRVIEHCCDLATWRVVLSLNPSACTLHISSQKARSIRFVYYRIRN